MKAERERKPKPLIQQPAATEQNNEGASKMPLKHNVTAGDSEINSENSFKATSLQMRESLRNSQPAPVIQGFFSRFLDRTGWGVENPLVSKKGKVKGEVDYQLMRYCKGKVDFDYFKDTSALENNPDLTSDKIGLNAARNNSKDTTYKLKGVW